MSGRGVGMRERYGERGCLRQAGLAEVTVPGTAANAGLTAAKPTNEGRWL